MSTSNDPSVKRRPRWRRVLVISGQLLLGLGLGAAIAEYAFDRRDDGAFPHVNFYLPDPELGVRLEPGASMRFQLRQNPVSTIHVNPLGYRGSDWPAPAPTDILVVGDSQVFGLGVDDDATFSARLASSSGRAVLNAGVPTYGPREYLATAKRGPRHPQGRQRRPRPQLRQRPLRARSPQHRTPRRVGRLGRAQRDRPRQRPRLPRPALAVLPLARRLRPAPLVARARQRQRPRGRRRRRRHRLRHPLRGRPARPRPRQQERPPGHLAARGEGHRAARADQQQRADTVTSEIASKRDDLDGLVSQASKFSFSYMDSEIARSRPGDIVSDDSSEAGRDVVVTAAMIREAARTREKLLTGLLKAEEKLADQPRPAHELIASQETLAAEQQRLREEIASGVPPISRPPSQFRGYLEQFKALCDQHGAELVVVALPIDVQVDPREWAKYGVTDAPDMRESLVLLDDLLADAHDLGLRGLDATPSLRAAEPDAFLDHDIHMTAKGHAALADALAATLLAPPPQPIAGPRPGLPVGRSFVPTAAEWANAPALLPTGDIETGCTLQTQREWVRFLCPSRSRYDSHRRLMFGAGVTPATMVMASNDVISVVTPTTIDRPFSLRLMSKGKGKRSPAGSSSESFELVVRPTAGPGGAPQYSATVAEAVYKMDDGFRTMDLSALFKLSTPIQGLCDCHREVYKERLCLEPGLSKSGMPVPAPPAPAECPYACTTMWGDQRLAETCLAAFTKCDERLACAQNDPLFAPACPEGQIHAYASNACFAVCDAQKPCAAGTCTPWHGGSVCVVD
jgi:hypothetical protein